jgi:hypothetical protein
MGLYRIQTLRRQATDTLHINISGVEVLQSHTAQEIRVSMNSMPEIVSEMYLERCPTEQKF